MPSFEARLRAGMEAQDWRQTASASSKWERWGKFGRGAYYIILEPCRVQDHKPQTSFICRPGNLYWSPLHEREPFCPVEGPVLDTLLKAGDAALKRNPPPIDAEALLINLMDGKPK